jgi:hypothetical protein
MLLRPRYASGAITLAAVATLSLGACRSGDAAGKPTPSSAGSGTPASPDERGGLRAPGVPQHTKAAAASDPALAVTLTRTRREEFVSRLSSCEIEHYGRLVDLGSEKPSPWAGFRFTEPTPEEVVTRDGATYLEATSRGLDFRIWLDQPIDKLRVTLRGRAGVAKRVQVTFDDRRLGVVRLPEREPRAFDLPELAAVIPPGLHRIALRFSGAPRSSRGVQAELDWLRIASATDHRDDTNFAPPTLADVVENVTLADTPRRSVVLRAPTTLRCFLRPAAAAKFRVALGLWGSGRGAAEIVVRREGGEPVTLDSRRVAGGESSVWTPVEVELGKFAGEPISLELRAVEATKGGRIAFGDPELVEVAAPVEAPRARVVVLVVLSSVDQAGLPPWGSGGNLPALRTLAHAGAAFGRYRAPTTVSAGVLTTLLTGLLPRAHGVEAPMLRVPATLRTLPQLVKESNGSAAMFTSVPTSFAPFGFDLGWDRFEAYSPVKDIAASEPFTRAAAWLAKELEERPLSRHLVVIHARGAHPPWDIPREDAQQLKPNEYNGAIEPRRGGILISALRARGPRSGKRLVDDDFVRIRALGEVALAKQDAALGNVISVLKRANVWDASLVAVVGDAAPGAPPDLPYDPAGPLGEERLSVPLIVKMPGGAFANKEIQAQVTAPDIAVTLAHALDLPLPEGSFGIDLGLRAGGQVAPDGDAQHATLPGRYATRLGSWLLRGELGNDPRLCALDIDPACSVDAFADRGIAARVAWLATLAGEARHVPKELGTAPRTPAELDAETRAALMVWGDLPN